MIVTFYRSRKGTKSLQSLQDIFWHYNVRVSECSGHDKEVALRGCKPEAVYALFSVRIIEDEMEFTALLPFAGMRAYLRYRFPQLQQSF